MDPKELEDKSKSLIKQKLNEAIIDPFTYAVLKEKLDDNVDLQKRVNEQIGFLKQPKTARLISIFFGPLGLDRLYLFQPFLFVLKLCTIGGFGLWWLIDIFFISKATKKINGKTITKLIAGKTIKKPLYFNTFAKLNTLLTDRLPFPKTFDFAYNDYKDIGIALSLVLLGYPSFIAGEPKFSYLACAVAAFFYGKFHLKKTYKTMEILKARSKTYSFEWFYNQANFSEPIPLAEKHDSESFNDDYSVGHVYGSFADFNFGAIKKEIESERAKKK